MKFGLASIAFVGWQAGVGSLPSLSLSFSIFAYFFPFLSPFHPSCLLMLQQKACCCRPVEERLRWPIQRTQAQLEPGEKLSKRANEQTPAQGDLLKKEKRRPAAKLRASRQSLLLVSLKRQLACLAKMTVGKAMSREGERERW